MGHHVLIVGCGFRGWVGEVYNVTDDLPHSGVDYFNAIADSMGVPRPRVDYTQPAEGCAELVRESNKKCSNKKLKGDFNYTFKFRSYREGIADAARRKWKESRAAATPS